MNAISLPAAVAPLKLEVLLPESTTVVDDSVTMISVITSQLACIFDLLIRFCRSLMRTAILLSISMLPPSNGGGGLASHVGSIAGGVTGASGGGATGVGIDATVVVMVSLELVMVSMELVVVPLELVVVLPLHGAGDGDATGAGGVTGAGDGEHLFEIFI